MRPILWVDPDRCRACERCRARAVCRTRAVRQLEPGDLPIIETQRCLGCQVCIAACEAGAIGLLDERQAPGSRAAT